MCFSLEASIGAGVLLSSFGILTLKKTTIHRQLMFAAIPLIFGIQQFIEGLLWFTIPKTEFQNITLIGSFSFVFIAQVIWPIWIPVSVYLFDPKSRKSVVLKGFIIAGFLISVFLGICLFRFPFIAQIENKHILYLQDYTHSFEKIVISIYILVTSFSPLFSKIKGMKVLSLMIIGSCIIAALFYFQFILSVWCFFASIISVKVYLIVRNQNQTIVNV